MSAKTASWNKAKGNRQIPEELFTILLIQFRENVLDRVFIARDDDVLNCINTTVRQLNDLVQDDKGSLGKMKEQKSVMIFEPTIQFL